MPTQLILNTNQACPSLKLEFIDANNNVVAVPDGAKVTFAVDYPSVLSATPDANDQTTANLALEEVTALTLVTITVSVTGATDVDGNPYADQVVRVQISPGTPEIPAVPATPPSLMFGLVQTQPIPAPSS